MEYVIALQHSHFFLSTKGVEAYCALFLFEGILFMSDSWKLERKVSHIKLVNPLFLSLLPLLLSHDCNWWRAIWLLIDNFDEHISAIPFSFHLEADGVAADAAAAEEDDEAGDHDGDEDGGEGGRRDVGALDMADGVELALDLVRQLVNVWAAVAGLWERAGQREGVDGARLALAWLWAFVLFVGAEAVEEQRLRLQLREFFLSRHVRVHREPQDVSALKHFHVHVMTVARHFQILSSKDGHFCVHFCRVVGIR